MPAHARPHALRLMALAGAVAEARDRGDWRTVEVLRQRADEARDELRAAVTR
jgi:hypothetical protein